MKTYEPLDDEIEMEEPVLLKQAMEKILDHKVKTPMIILNDLNLIPLRKPQNIFKLAG